MEGEGLEDKIAGENFGPFSHPMFIRLEKMHFYDHFYDRGNEKSPGVFLNLKISIRGTLIISFNFDVALNSEKSWSIESRSLCGCEKGYGLMKLDDPKSYNSRFQLKISIFCYFDYE